MTPEIEQLMERLAEPFDLDEVKFKPAVVSGNRALALAYVDARVIQDRLDEVLGPAGWQDEYEMLPDGSAVCRLRLRIGGEWIMKMDVGGPSEQPDEGDRNKAAFSDALKRAAVKFGVGRYLYRLPQLWADYDAQKRQFRTKPTLPASAQPKKPATPSGQKPQPAHEPAPQQQSAPQAQQTPAQASGEKKLPTFQSGRELSDWLDRLDEKATKAGICKNGDLRLKAINATKAKSEKGLPMLLPDWPAGAVKAAIQFAWDIAAEMKAVADAKKAEHKVERDTDKEPALFIAVKGELARTGFSWDEAIVEFLKITDSAVEPSDLTEQQLRRILGCLGEYEDVHPETEEVAS